MTSGATTLSALVAFTKVGSRCNISMSNSCSSEFSFLFQIWNASSDSKSVALAGYDLPVAKLLMRAFKS